ncbi:hypothetical protein ACKKBF_B10810 [Auxenochlorella protothecoides x Auxenochlorella symbiontica]
MQFSHDTPRSIRVRLTRGRPQKSRHEQAAVTSSNGCTDIMLSPTGRESLGPWSGAFEEASSIPTSPTVFSDGSGVIFSDLRGSPVPSFTEGQLEEGAAQKERELMDAPLPRDSRRRHGAAPAPGMNDTWVDNHVHPSNSGGSRRRMRGLMQPTRGQA